MFQNGLLHFCLTTVASVLLVPVYVPPVERKDGGRFYGKQPSRCHAKGKKAEDSVCVGDHIPALPTSYASRGSWITKITTCFYSSCKGRTSTVNEDVTIISYPPDHPFTPLIPQLITFEKPPYSEPPKMAELTDEMKAIMLRRLEQLKIPSQHGGKQKPWNKFLLNGKDITYIKPSTGGDFTCLDRGCRSESYLCWMGHEVVVRIFKKDHTTLETVVEEIDVIRDLASLDITPSLVGFVPLVETPGFLNIGLVSEYSPSPASGQSEITLAMVMLHEAELLRNKKAPSLSRMEWIKFVQYLVLSMKALHSKYLVQGSIRLDNIQLRKTNDEWKPVFIDFSRTAPNRKAGKFRSEVEDFGAAIHELSTHIPGCHVPHAKLGKWCMGMYQDEPNIQTIIDFIENDVMAEEERLRPRFLYGIEKGTCCYGYKDLPNPDWLEIARDMQRSL